MQKFISIILVSGFLTACGTGSEDAVNSALNTIGTPTATTPTTPTAPAATTRFVDKGDGTIYDNTTKLTWLRNADCWFGQNWDYAVIKANTLAAGQCGLTDSSKAGDWHLPTVTELRAFVDAGYRYDTLMTASGFLNVSSLSVYWTSTVDASNPGYPYTVNMKYGTVNNTGFPATYTNLRVWPVR